MYIEHEVFSQPQDASEKVWRYMDFTKFLSVLESQSLYFTRADKFEDPFEGSYPKINVIARQQIPLQVPEPRREGLQRAIDQWGVTNKQWPKYTAINCWHLNNHESAAMWRLYLKSNEGIAIQTTYQKFRDSFSKTTENVLIGKVSYIDYEKESIKTGNFLTPFVHKRKSFEHEREIRALVMRPPIDDEKGLNFNRETINHGVSIPVDINKIIEKIFVSPEAPTWFTELVKAVVKRYGCNYEVTQSDLNQKPLY